MSDRLGLGNLGSRSYGTPRRGFPSVGRPPSSAKSRRIDYEEGRDNLFDVDLETRLHEQALGAENKAGEPKIAERARAAVFENIAASRDTLEYLRNKWLVDYRLYRGESLDDHPYGRIRLHCPEPFKAVEQIHPRVMQALFGQDPWFKIMGEEWKDEDNATNHQALCSQQLREMRYRQKADAMVRDLVIYGTCAQKLYWRRDARDVRYAVTQTVPDELREGLTRKRRVEVARREIVVDGNEVDQVSIFDLYAPALARSAEEAEWMADRSQWPLYRLLEYGRRGIFKNLDQLKDYEGDNDVNQGDEYKERKAYSFGVYDTNQATLSGNVPHYTVIDWWGNFRISEDEDEPEVPCNIVIVSPNQRGVVAVVRENPHWHGRKPYQVARWIKLSDEFYGVGAIEMIARLSYELDRKRNLYDASTQLEACPMVVAGDGANIPDSQLVATPGLVLRAGNADDIKPLFLPRVSDAALQAMQDLKQEIRETHGVTTSLMGSGQVRPTTATAHVSDVNESSVRLVGGIANIEDEVLTPMIEMMVSNNQQFLSRPRVISRLGPQGLKYEDRFTVRPENLTGRFAVEVLVARRVTTLQVMTQQLVNLLDRAPVINQQAGAEIVRLRPLLARIFRDGFGIRDVSDFITLDPKEAGLMSAIEEHEAWVHGVVPRVRMEDDHVSHFQAHQEWIESEDGQRLGQEDPGAYHLAVAHAAEHAKEIARIHEIQQRAIMEATQASMLQGGGGGPAAAEAGGRGFEGGEGQSPDSPKFRRPDGGSEEEREVRKSAASNSPNQGAS